MSTDSIPYPDRHFLNAAIGWLALGNGNEAEAELNLLSPEFQSHADILVVRWKIYASTQRWDCSLGVARALFAVASDRPTSWICLSYSLYYNRRTLEAWDQMHTAVKKFPEVSAIPYFLGRLSCHMGNSEEAARWLTKWEEMETRNEEAAAVTAANQATPPLIEQRFGE